MLVKSLIQAAQVGPDELRALLSRPRDLQCDAIAGEADICGFHTERAAHWLLDVHLANVARSMQIEFGGGPGLKLLQVTDLPASADYPPQLPSRLPSTHTSWNGRGSGRQGGAPCWTNDLDALGRDCSALPGSTADGMGDPHARHTRPAPANGAPAISEPERPRRRHVLTERLCVQVSTYGP